MIAEPAWRSAVDAIAAAQRPVLACHVGPDGDALGSMVAVMLALQARGADVVASFGDPFVIPDQYRFLPGLDRLTKPEDAPRDPAVMITFDCGAYDRLGSLEPVAHAARTLIVVDHHRSNDAFGSIALIDPDAAATAVIARELLARLGAGLDPDIATCLYTGLVTDTGRFQYRNTTPAVHQLAAELIDAGAPQDDIGQAIYGTHPVGYLKVAAMALERLVVRDGVVWTWISRDDLTSNGIGLEDTDALIDLVRTADVADVALVLKQQPDGTFKASMRSKGATNVGAVCERFGGGGHALAAGFRTGETSPAPVAERVIEALGAEDLPPP